MPSWKLSRHTVIFRCEDGTALLHNSFMGAVAVIPPAKFVEVEKHLYKQITEEQLENASLKELCANGFFFPCHIDEQTFVSTALSRENKPDNFDVILLPHENCNFRCNYCYESHNRGRMAPEVVAALKVFMEHKAAECKSLTLRWFGGEPLLAKDIIYDLSDSFVQSCEKHGVRYWSQITTNGYLLTPAVVDCLLDRKITNYQVTLDGPESTHDTTRALAGGGKTFQRILNNLMGMKKKDRSFAVAVRVNFNDESVAAMTQLYEVMSESFGDDPRFGLYFRPIGKYGGPNDDQIQACEPASSKLIEMELAEKYLQFGYLDSVVRQSLQPHGQVCYAGKESSIVVGGDGALYKCSVAFEDPNNRVGKLLLDGTLSIDQALWNLWVNNPDIDQTKCTSCPVSPMCQGKYCPRHAIRERQPVCPMTPVEYFRLVQIASSDHHRLL